MAFCAYIFEIFESTFLIVILANANSSAASSDDKTSLFIILRINELSAILHAAFIKWLSFDDVSSKTFARSLRKNGLSGNSWILDEMYAIAVSLDSCIKIKFWNFNFGY